jgi:hypothetical protein
MKLKENESISFLDVLVTKKQDGMFGHKVFRKKTHTDSYLHADSHHHPYQKIGVLNTLAIRETRISDKYHLEQDMDHLTRVFDSIGYGENDIKNVIKNNEGRNRPQNNQK